MTDPSLRPDVALSLRHILHCFSPLGQPNCKSASMALGRHIAARHIESRSAKDSRDEATRLHRCEAASAPTARAPSFSMSKHSAHGRPSRTSRAISSFVIGEFDSTQASPRLAAAKSSRLIPRRSSGVLTTPRELRASSVIAGRNLKYSWTSRTMRGSDRSLAAVPGWQIRSVGWLSATLRCRWSLPARVNSPRSGPIASWAQQWLIAPSLPR